jgi:hypothetical protein
MTSASEAEMAECQSAQAWSTQEAAVHQEPPYKIVGTFNFEDIEFIFIWNNDDNLIYLQASHIDPTGSWRHKILQGLGFFQEVIMLQFLDVADKIHQYTSQNTNVTNPHETIPVAE